MTTRFICTANKSPITDMTKANVKWNHNYCEWKMSRNGTHHYTKNLLPLMKFTFTHIWNIFFYAQSWGIGGSKKRHQLVSHFCRKFLFIHLASSRDCRWCTSLNRYYYF
jgi:hypothetical protein